MSDELPSDESSMSLAEDGAGQGSSTSQRRTFLLTIAYDGSDYFGWQRQSAARTVQETLEDILDKLLGERIHLMASSRTDTGVHALGQRATLRTRHWKATGANLAMAINTKTPPDLAIRSAVEVPSTFHPTRDAYSKRYRYSIYASRVCDPNSRRNRWWIKKRLNVAAMIEASRYLIGEHDFEGLQTAGSPRISTVRHVTAIDIATENYLDGHLVTIEVQANGFLYNMVRNIVGTLVSVGTGLRPVHWVQDVLDGRDRRHAGQTAPAHGLCLLEIYFPSEKVSFPCASCTSLPE